MDIQEFEVVSNKAIIYLTNNNSKSRSVNSLYLMAKRILKEFIIKKGGFEFTEVLSWIKENQNLWYKGKFKAIKRFTFSIHDYECNGAFTTDKFVYYTTNELIHLVSGDEANLITEFIVKNKYKGTYCGNVRNSLSHFYLYLRDKKLLIDNLTLSDYEELYYYLKETFPKVYFEKTVGLIKRFMDFYQSKYNKGPFMSFILYTKIINHLPYLRDKVVSNEALTSLTKNAECNLSINFFSDNNINNFIKAMKEHNYSRSITKHIKYQINLFHLFIYFIDYKYSTDIAEYWIDNIIKPINKGYLSYRNIVLRYMDFNIDKLSFRKIYSKPRTFDIEKVYVRENHFEKVLPSWSKNIVLEYFSYRRCTGCVEATITNDKSAILTLCLFLDSNGISSFNKITPEILIEYTKNEKHDSLEGKNNYISRVKGFVRYLQDLNIIPTFNLSVILEGCRVPQKVITTLPDEMVEAIYNLKDNLETSVELRAYAIFMLGLRLGIRSYDVANLKFENISFKDMTISFVQSKTRKFIELPMPTEVANAIYNYVKLGRGKCNSDYIFISRDAPYVKIGRTVCGTDFKHLIRMAGYTPISGGGFHILRRTYASNLLKGKKNISQVALALGHSTNGTVDQYLNINKEAGYLCPLELDLIPYRGKSL